MMKSKLIVLAIVISIFTTSCIRRDVQDNTTEPSTAGSNKTETTITEPSTTEPHITEPPTTEPVTTPTTTEKFVEPTISINPVEIMPGDFFTVFIADTKADDVIEYSTEISKKEIESIPYKNGHMAFVPVDYRTAPGNYDFKVKVSRDGEAIAEKNASIALLEKEFIKHYITVSKEQAATRTDEGNLQSDGAHTSKARSESSPTPLWDGSFIIPLEARLSSEFGIIRYVNKAEVGRHSGFDLSIEAGNPIKASNSGRVVLAMELIITGNTVIIDHGLNVFTAYSHCSKLLVEKGDEVKKGDVIAEVGSTGFSTGPHLHWTVSIGSTFVNPWLFVDKDPLDLLQPQN